VQARQLTAAIQFHATTEALFRWASRADQFYTVPPLSTVAFYFLVVIIVQILIN
jgi:hypothetical protein